MGLRLEDLKVSWDVLPDPTSTFSSSSVSI